MRNHRAAHGLRVIAVGIALAGSSACGAGRHGVSKPPPAYLYFTNDSQDQADVYAVVSGSQRVRLGTVHSNRTETLVLPGDIVARPNVSVVVRLLARNNTPSSGPLVINPGDKLSIRLPADQRQLVVLPGDR